MSCVICDKECAGDVCSSCAFEYGPNRSPPPFGMYTPSAGTSHAHLIKTRAPGSALEIQARRAPAEILADVRNMLVPSDMLVQMLVEGTHAPEIIRGQVTDADNARQRVRELFAELVTAIGADK